MPRRWFKSRPPVDGNPAEGATASLSAAASVVGPATWQRLRTAGSSMWQAESWDYYENVPEYRFVVDWLASSASRALLFVTEVDDSGKPIADNAVVARSATFLGGPVMQAPLIHDIVLQLLVPGEMYVYVQLVDGGEIWDVASVDEVSIGVDGIVTIDHGDGDVFTLDPNESLVIKIWDPDPRRRSQPTSPSRAVRGPMREIVRCDQTISAQVDSRLATAGILLLPKEMSFSVAGAEQAEGPGDDGGADTFMNVLTEAMMTAIQDRDSPAAVVPIVIRAPADTLDKPRLLALSTPVSETLLTLRDSAIKRLAMGLDINPEQLLGVGSTNHLSSWQMAESLVTTQIVPLLELICAAFTEQYLWPALQVQSIEDFRRFIVWYDVSALVQRPDRAADAQAVYDRDELSGTALRRANGFTEDDAPTEAEQMRNALIEIAGKVPTAAPALVNQLLQAFGLRPDAAVSIEPAAGPGAQARGIETSAPQQARPLPSTAPTMASAALAASASRSSQPTLLAAAEALTLQALETAGKRLVGRNRYKLDPLPPHEYHTNPNYACTPTSAARVLEGCFVRGGHVDVVAITAGVSPELLRRTLHDYTAGLLCSGRSHSIEALAYALSDAQLGEKVTVDA